LATYRDGYSIGLSRLTAPAKLRLLSITLPKK
jgi:hypothetical protein